MKKTLALLSVLMLLVLPLQVLAEGEDVVDVTPVNPVTEVNNTNNTQTDSTTNPNTNEEVDVIDQVQNSDITISHLGDKIIKKLVEVQQILQTIVAPIVGITFILGAIWAVIGAFFKKDGIKNGLVICVISVVVFALCMYAEPIITAFAAWIGS